jgi:uncharacterized metal-binding protein
MWSFLMIKKESTCSCGGKCEQKLLYACSGAANTGLLSDMISRKLRTQEGYTMTCLAGLGADLSGFIETAKAAKNIVIDGCPVRCGAKIFKKYDIAFEHHILTEYGVEKGKTAITSALVNRIIKRVAGQ